MDSGDDIMGSSMIELRPEVPPPLPTGLKDVGSLAKWSVSSHKPGCGVEALQHPSTDKFWQSDGPQPHHLDIHFFKFMSIVHIRVFLDHRLDESYTPIKLQFLAGTGYHDLTELCVMSFKEPTGWMEVDLSNAGGRPALEPIPPSNAFYRDWMPQNAAFAQTLRCFLIQVRILENMQNGKDTHLRGLQLFAVDESMVKDIRSKMAQGTIAPSLYSKTAGSRQHTSRLASAEEPNWLIEEPSLR